MLPIGLMCSLNWSIFDLNCSSESSPDRCCSNRARIFGVTMGGLDSRSAWSLVESFSGSDLARISLDLFFSSAVSKVGWLTCGGLVCPESLIFILGTLLDFRPFSFVDWLISKIGARFWYQVLVSGFYSWPVLPGTLPWGMGRSMCFFVHIKDCEAHVED